MSTVSVKVVTRIRPQNKIESSRGGKPCVTVQRDGTEVFLSTDDEGEYRFTFDRVFGPTSKQKDVFEYIGRPVIDSIFKGYNGTIFAYGQTSSGKTHTMSGPDGSIGEPEHRGVIPRCIAYIFEKFGEADEHIEFTVQTSFMEIYLERVKDLLNIEKSNLPIREEPGRGIYVDGVTEEYVTSPDECLQKIQEAGANRVVAATGMNAGSSRSHSVTIIKLTAMDTKTGTKKNGKLCLVDLAGSEMVRKTGAKGQQLKEAQMINKSLSALGNVINALTAGKTKHIPYRDSKLTRLLQDSLGGNTKTVMCANCGPAGYNYDETLSTLRYANRAKNIKNKPRINEDPKDAMLREFQEEIMRLKKQLQNGGGGGGGGGGGFGGGGKVQERIVEKVVYKEGISEAKMKELEERNAKQRAEIENKARNEQQRLRLLQEQAEKEKKAMEEAVARERAEAGKAEKARQLLKKKLAAMENKLLIGGDLMDKAAKQEYELRQAQIELEERRRQEQELARELAEREEATMMVEEQFASLSEEVDVKTKKLKKVWQKYQQAKEEIKDMGEEFGREREDMLDTIRDLQRQLKLKDMILDNFVPPDEVEQLHRRAKWNEENESWQVARLEIAGNKLRGRRPLSANNSRRPESEFARHRKQYDNNPRYRGDNIVNFDLDMPQRTTHDYEGPAMSQRVQAALNAALIGEEDEVTFQPPENLPNATNFNPYLNYNGEDGGGNDGGNERREYNDESRNKDRGGGRPKSGKRSRRPRTADRRRRRDGRSRDDDNEGKKDRDDVYERENRERDMESQFPKSRGLVGR